MINYLITLLKKYPSIFLWIKKNDFLMGWISWFLQLRFTATRGGILLVFMFLYYSFCHYILCIQKDIAIKIKNITITMPNHMRALDGTIEVLYDSFYDKLQGYECILDLGGYIGESAIRLSQTNKKVIVYEAHPENYRYLLKNIHPYDNIISYNDAVVGNEQKTMIFYGGAFDMGAGNHQTFEKKQVSEISCTNILNILKGQKFDAIKMDIEGAEYECMTALMHDHGSLFKRFKAGFIEFHFYNEIDKVNQTIDIIERIMSLGYSVECFDAVSSSKIGMQEIKKFEIVFIYFTV